MFKSKESNIEIIYEFMIHKFLMPDLFRHQAHTSYSVALVLKKFGCPLMVGKEESKKKIIFIL